MKRTLYRYFIIGYLVFGLASFAVVALISSRLTFQVHLQSAADLLYEQARAIANDYDDVYTVGRFTENLPSHLEGFSRYSDLRIWFVSVDGLIAYDSAGAITHATIASFDPAEVPGNYRTGNFYGVFSQDMLSVLAPITAGLETTGYVILHTPLATISGISESMLAPIYTTAAIIFVLSLALLWVFRTYVVVPLRKITTAASEFSSGNLKHTISVQQRDEIGYLANTLNMMAEELASSENYQKRFIANISHDFRSPLTSIKGYLVAIIDGVIPPENQEKYIRVVINETERLENLTQSMLSLNSLDRQNMHLEYSDFNICSLIRNVCATLEGKCRIRGITFDLILAGAVINVHADMGKIQQVLYNLLDNAVKFSGNDSIIVVSVKLLRGKALISVKDSGMGISKEDLKQIWTRFFKSDASRGRDKQGSGLGLAIVKEIISAHNETIDVISTEGAGTEFSFRLPLAEAKEAEY